MPAQSSGDPLRARVRIEKLVYGGDGLARHNDTAVFVPFVLPGEEVDVEYSSRGRGVARGAVVGWAERSPERLEPPCPVFARCGGCHYQHFSYEGELAAKESILRETLRRIGGLAWEGPVDVVSAEPWGYRNRCHFHLGWHEGSPEIGFFEAGSHRLVDATDCPINSPALNKAHAALREMAGDKRFPRTLRSVEFFTDERQLQMNLPRRPGPLPRRFWSWCAERLGVEDAGSALHYPCGDDVFRVSGKSFFQVNRHLAPRLSGLAVGEAEGDMALDLYCGVGLLSLPLARAFSRVVAVDSGGVAIRDLQSNVTRARLPVRPVRSGVLDFLTGFRDSPDLVVADPPRAGLGSGVTEQILRIGPPRLRLVSCDPATHARDLKQLVGGGYRVESIALVDLFPRTFHLETVTALRR